MALNVEQIENRLAMMQDAELQKYAAMNKNDPYIMALAVSESNRRKKVRQAQQGMQGQMPQPKVVDRAVQGMAAPMPEDVGIARLSAGDMNFADGGIVAFADGGDVERYNGMTGSLTGEVQRILQKSPYERTPQDNAILAQAGYEIKSRTLGPDSGVAGVNTFLQGVGPRIRDYFTGGASRLSDEELAQKPAVGGVATERILRGLGAEQATAPLGPQASYSNEGRREPGLFAVAPAAAPAATDKTAPKVDTTQRGPGAGPGTSAASATGGLEDIFKRLQGTVDKDITSLRDQRKTFAQSLQDFAKKEEADFEAAEAKRGDPFKGREERIAKREGELAGMKNKNLGAALFFAGAEIMGTPGGLAKALSAGIKTGGAQYAAGIDKLNAAQERLMDARDRLDELRVNRDDLTAKERRLLKSNINRSVLEGEKLFLDGAEKDLGYRREDMKTLFSGLVTDMASQRSAGATIEAARIRSQDQKDYLEAIRGGDMVEKARKNIMDAIIKANPYADEATRQRLYDKEWEKALQTNPALAKYSGVTPGGGSASSADPLGLR